MKAKPSTVASADISSAGISKKKDDKKIPPFLFIICVARVAEIQERGRRSLKKRMKGLAALALVFFMAAAFAVDSANASGELIYLCINDSFITGLTSSNMPIKINNSIYIPYRYLARIKPIKYFYDEDSNILKVYNTSATIIFDVGNHITYDQNSKIYSYLAEKRNGVLYVPIEFICRVFGAYYSQFSSSFGTVVRINSIMSSFSDEKLVSENREVMQEIYDKYMKDSKPPEDTVDPPPTPEPGQTETPSVRKTVYVAVLGAVNDSSYEISSRASAYNLKVTFFLEKEGMKENSDTLRAIVCRGHSIGLYVSAGDPLGEAEELNGLLSGLVMRKSRIVCIKEGSAALTADQRRQLTDSGYRIWDAAVDPTGGRNSYAVAQNASNLLSRGPRTLVLRLRSDEKCAGAAGTVFAGLTGGSYTVREIKAWTTPVNSIRYYN